MKLRQLDSSEINKLASAKGVKAIAVQNFLSSLYDSDSIDAMANCRMDARLYKWNAATVNAIQKGIDLASKNKP